MTHRNPRRGWWIAFGVAAASVGALAWVMLGHASDSNEIHGPADGLLEQPNTDARRLAVGVPAAAPDELQPWRLVSEEPRDQPAATVAQAAPEVNDVRHLYRDGNPYRMYVDPQVFAERYADATLEELRSAKSVVEARSHDLGAKAGNEFLDAGRGEFELTPRAESLDAVPVPPAEESYGLINMRRTQVTSNGELAVEKGRLPWEEYKAVYDLQDELFWLIHEIRKRERDLAASGSTAPDGK